MAGGEVPAIACPAGQGAADGAVVVLRSDRRGPFAKAAAAVMCHRRACERGEGSGADRRAKRPPGQPPATLLAAFEPSLHFVDVVHALDDDAAGRGG